MIPKKKDAKKLQDFHPISVIHATQKNFLKYTTTATKQSEQITLFKAHIFKAF
jgi:hypothetical protein